MAYIYLTDSESGQTVYEIHTSIKARPKPEAFDKPEEAELFREAIRVVNSSVDRATEAETSAAADANRAESAATIAEQAKKDAERAAGVVVSAKDDADRAELAAQNAADYANSALHSADIAKSASNIAEFAAESASGSAIGAESANDIASVTVVKMEKSCCADMLEYVFDAAKMSRLPIPIQVTNLFVDAEDVTE